MKCSFLLFSLTMMAACGQKDVDREQAVIRISSPSAGQRYDMGHPVPLKATITDNEALEEVQWQVLYDMNGQSGAYILKKSEKVSAKTFTIDEHFSPPYTGSYIVLVIATDRFGNRSIQDITFKVD